MNNASRITRLLLSTVLWSTPSALFANVPAEHSLLPAFDSTECASATENNIGGWSVQNVCSQPIDLGLAFRVHGSNNSWTFRVYRRLNPGFQVDTPNCFECGYDIFVKAYSSSEHVSDYELRPDPR